MRFWGFPHRSRSTLFWAEHGYEVGEPCKAPNPGRQQWRTEGSISALQKGDHPKSPKGTVWPAQLQAQLLLLLLMVCSANTGFLPLHRGIRDAFFSFVLLFFLHTFTFMLRFIDLLAIGVISAGYTFSSTLFVFIILLDTTNALWLGSR